MKSSPPLNRGTKSRSLTPPPDPARLSSVNSSANHSTTVRSTSVPQSPSKSSSYETSTTRPSSWEDPTTPPPTLPDSPNSMLVTVRSPTTSDPRAFYVGGVLPYLPVPTSEPKPLPSSPTSFAPTQLISYTKLTMSAHYPSPANSSS